MHQYLIEKNREISIFIFFFFGITCIYFRFVGHASIIGFQTGKVVGYSVRSKPCRVCSNAHKSGTVPRPHDCRQNWNGTFT